MKKKAIISVTSKQSKDESGDIEIVTPGEFYKKEQCYYAVYKETAISGMEGTTTTMKIYPEHLSLIRMGSTTAKMEFMEDKEDVVLYNTPYGVIELKIETKNMSINVDDEGGEVVINYNMTVSGQKPLKTYLKVNIKTQ